MKELQKNHGQEPMESFFKETYGGVDESIRSNLIERIGPDLEEHARYVEEYGITKISGLFSTEEVEKMQDDVAKWRSEKEWNRDNHMGFDGNSGEAYLPTSESLSRAVTHPAITTVAAAAFGQHPRMNFVRTYSINPIDPYFRRAFQWHHDGYSEYGFKAMILISDVPEGGQAMIFCPGTHKKTWPTNSSRETQFNHEFANSFGQYECSGKAGDVFIFNPHALHRGTRNLTERRDVIVANFQPGIARNYPLPGIHPNVEQELSEYQKAVYRVGEQFEPVSEADFQQKLNEFREKMRSLFESWNMPTHTIQSGLKNGVDLRISLAAQINSELDPDIQPHVENVSNQDIEDLQNRIKNQQSEFHSYLGSESSDSFIDITRQFILDEMQKDLHGDLDLPIRMYHPNRDQRRDNAITQTRDRDGSTHFSRLEEGLLSITADQISSVDLNEYIMLMDEMINQKEGLFDLVADNDHNLQKMDSYICFAEDLQEMLSRAHSVDLIRRTTLYAHLTLSKVVDFLEQLDDSQAENLKYMRDKSLFTYASFVAFDGYSKVHGQE